MAPWSIRILFLFTLLSLWTNAGLALPRFALMAGTRCASCHVNPTGGQMRNEYGASFFSVDALPVRSSVAAEGEQDSTMESDEEEEEFTFSAKISDNISIGADYRSQFIYSFAEDPSDMEKGKSAFHAMTAGLYGAATISKNVTFYFKQDILNSGYYGAFVGPEVFAVAKVLPNKWYVKGGTFLPDYGWRIDDHTAYTRGGDIGFIPGGATNSGLMFLPNYKDIGIEVGGYAGGLFVTGGVFNGTGNTSKIAFEKDKAYSLKAEYMGKMSSMNYRLGVSGYGYKSFKMGGILAGVGVGDLVIYGEMDWTHHQQAGMTVNEDVNAMAAFLEADYRLKQGIWAIARYDKFDPLSGVRDDDLAAGTNSVGRLNLGFEIFPYSFVELRPFYRMVIEKPSTQNDQAVLHMHVWF